MKYTTIIALIALCHAVESVQGVPWWKTADREARKAAKAAAKAEKQAKKALKNAYRKVDDVYEEKKTQVTDSAADAHDRYVKDATDAIDSITDYPAIYAEDQLPSKDDNKAWRDYWVQQMDKYGKSIDDDDVAEYTASYKSPAATTSTHVDPTEDTKVYYPTVTPSTKDDYDAPTTSSAKHYEPTTSAKHYEPTTSAQHYEPTTSAKHYAPTTSAKHYPVDPAPPAYTGDYPVDSASPVYTGDYATVSWTMNSTTTATATETATPTSDDPYELNGAANPASGSVYAFISVVFAVAVLL